MGQIRHGVAVCTAVCVEEHAGRELSHYQSKQLIKSMVRILSQRVLAVVSSKQKAMSSASPVASALTGSGAATQTELPRKHSHPGLKLQCVCPSFLSVSEGSREYNCWRCGQAEKQLSLMAELSEEVGRLRSIRQSEKEIGGIILHHPGIDASASHNIRYKGSTTFSPPGNDEAAVRSKETARAIKRDCRSLRQLVKSSGAQVVFSSILPVAGNGIGRNRPTQLINTWL
ncbi:uncharacterized protein LOC118159969 [Oxyura jamaicensis]|uniref:uncharacterized protein LOC118159969 n=1 Tax=Oxyura jamaicensis TaxID=8884 RepID=UPI0015A52785|nr:uncharacterized protein LOC118159969 [Oxyura jamaicensis]